MTQELATLSGNGTKFIDIIDEAILADPEDYNLACFKIRDGHLDVLSAVGNEDVCASYSSFTEEFLDDISTPHEEVEALLNLKFFQFYFDLTNEGGEIEFRFLGDTTEEPVEKLVMESSEWETEFYLKQSEKSRNRVPHYIREKTTDDNNFLSGDEKSLTTTIEADADTVARIVEVVDSDQLNLDNYPFIVDDGQLVLDAQDQDTQRDRVRGELSVKSVEGDDVANEYGGGFPQTFQTFSGPVTIRTAPGGAPMMVVQDQTPGATIRHFIASKGPVE